MFRMCGGQADLPVQPAVTGSAPYFLQAVIVGSAIAAGPLKAQAFKHPARLPEVVRINQHVAVAAVARGGRGIEIICDRRALEQDGKNVRGGQLAEQLTDELTMAKLPYRLGNRAVPNALRDRAGPARHRSGRVAQQSRDTVVLDLLDNRRVASGRAHRHADRRDVQRTLNAWHGRRQRICDCRAIPVHLILGALGPRGHFS